MANGSIEWMNNIRKSVDEIMSLTTSGKTVTLGEAEAIAARNNAELHNILAEISHRCQVDYAKGTIKCR